MPRFTEPLCLNSRARWISMLSCGLLGVTALSIGIAQESSSAGQTTTASAQQVPLLATIELPRIRVREYHRPYVAVWIEDEQRNLVRHISVWYQLGTNEEGHGEKWLTDLRQWWRRGGRELKMPVDGISGATRTFGKHNLRLTAAQLEALEPGTFHLVVEAAREVGGRELVRLPFEWPVVKQQQSTVSGKTELGEITLSVHPTPKTSK